VIIHSLLFISVRLGLCGHGSFVESSEMQQVTLKKTVSYDTIEQDTYNFGS